jgi:non-ribosomal peptide synthetase-like protein
LFLIFLIPVIVIVPLIPTIVGLHYLDENADWYSFYYLSTTPVFSFFYIILFISEVVLLTRVLKKGIKVGTHSVYSRTYIKKWFSDQLFALLLLVIKPIFATLYINKIYRLLGAKVGKNTEISNASNVSHHLLEIGDESFIADVAVIGESDIRDQKLILKKTIIGNKIFIGNSAVIPQGLNLGNNKLIGVLSIPPSQKKLDELETDWFGSPAIQLPKREINSKYPDTLTFNPSRLRKFIRGLIEFIRILIPQSLILCFSILFLAYAHDLVTKENILIVFLFFPIYYIWFVALPAFTVTLILKWLIVGKYRKAELPMWTLQVWLTEAVTSLYESLAIPYFLDFLQGTIFLPFFLKLLGVKIGKKVFLDTTDFTEFDLVSIGDYASLNHDSGPQTHLFEDRIMKMGPVNIESNVTIGAGTIILYDSIIARKTNIESLSLVMKGDRVPANSNWEGIPIRKK